MNWFDEVFYYWTWMFYHEFADYKTKRKEYHSRRINLRVCGKTECRISGVNFCELLSGQSVWRHSFSLWVATHSNLCASLLHIKVTLTASRIFQVLILFFNMLPFGNTLDCWNRYLATLFRLHGHQFCTLCTLSKVSLAFVLSVYFIKRNLYI